MTALLVIPWFKLEGWRLPIPHVGSVTLQPFGLLVALAILVGSRFAQRRADQLALPQPLIGEFILRTTVFGLLSAYALNIVMYQPEAIVEIAREPRLLLQRWYGLSSYGGFLGGALTAYVFARRRHASLLALGDAWCYAFPFAWVFARMGCFAVHDHPGAASDFFLAVADYNGTGVARHDLGLYEVIWAAGVSALFLVLNRRPQPAGMFLGLVPLLYGPVRFLLDFLRATPVEGGDVRYLGFTPAQYFSLALTVFGALFYMRLSLALRRPSESG